MSHKLSADEIATLSSLAPAPARSTTVPVLLTLPAHLLLAEDVIVLPDTRDETANVLVIVQGVELHGDPYLDDAPPVGLVTKDETGTWLCDYVEPTRKFSVLRHTTWQAADAWDCR